MSGKDERRITLRKKTPCQDDYTAVKNYINQHLHPQRLTPVEQIRFVPVEQLRLKRSDKINFSPEDCLETTNTSQYNFRTND